MVGPPLSTAKQLHLANIDARARAMCAC